MAREPGQALRKLLPEPIRFDSKVIEGGKGFLLHGSAPQPVRRPLGRNSIEQEAQQRPCGCRRITRFPT